MITCSTLQTCGAYEFVNVFDFSRAKECDACEVWTPRPLPTPIKKPASVVSISYPVRGSWWSVEQDWNPSRAKVLRHLRQSPNHNYKKFQEWDLESLSYEELQSLHSDDHEGKVQELLMTRKKPKVEREPAVCPT